MPLTVHLQCTTHTECGLAYGAHLSNRGESYHLVETTAFQWPLFIQYRHYSTMSVRRMPNWCDLLVLQCLRCDAAHSSNLQSLSEYMCVEQRRHQGAMHFPM
eukprot:scpid21178/ scgid20532/ 